MLSDHSGIIDVNSNHNKFTQSSLVNSRFYSPIFKKNENGMLRVFQCHICDKVFKTKALVSRHMITHSTAKPFKCEVCDKCYTRKDSLLYHKRKHKPQFAYACPVCFERCATKESFVKHLDTHTDENYKDGYS